MERQQESGKRVGLVALRIPAIILAALVVMLVIGVVVL